MAISSDSCASEPGRPQGRLVADLFLRLVLKFLPAYFGLLIPKIVPVYNGR